MKRANAFVLGGAALALSAAFETLPMRHAKTYYHPGERPTRRTRLLAPTARYRKKKPSDAGDFERLERAQAKRDRKSALRLVLA